MFIIRAFENYAARKSIAQSSPNETHDYAEMAIRTANKRAYLRGEGAKMQEWGISTVIINRRHGACGRCADFVGMVFIDDVYAGGKPSDHGGKYPLLSDAMKAGLFHPRCKDSSSLYIEGISTPPDREVLPKKAQEDLTEIERAEQRAAYGKRMEKMNRRLSKYALDPDNKKLYRGRAEQWSEYTEKWQSYHEKQLAKAEKSGIINIEIDEFVPCLKDSKTGKILPTEIREIPRRNLSKYTEKNGWNVNWAKRPKNEKVIGVFIKGEIEPQGMISLRYDRGGIYMGFASTAPQNNKFLNNGKQKYLGVGGHLFAAAVDESFKAGNVGGCVFGYAANKDLLKHYIKELGAIHLPIAHEYQIVIDGKAAQRLLDIHTFDRR